MSKKKSDLVRKYILDWFNGLDNGTEFTARDVYDYIKNLNKGRHSLKSVSAAGFYIKELEGRYTVRTRRDPTPEGQMKMQVNVYTKVR